MLRDVPVEKVQEFEDLFLTTLEQRHPDTLASFLKGKPTKEATDVLEALASELTSQYK
jgi:F-type H+-transporting ATPase subunit alpha